MKRVTIKDIASHLHLSTSTVSRALVDDKNIRRETRDRILAAADELGYRPNPVAKNLKYGRTNTIGMIVPELVTPFAAEVSKGVKSVFYPLGMKVLLADSEEDSAKELENLRMMERFMVEGIIISICDYKRNMNEFGDLMRKGMPIIFYDRIPQGLEASRVVVDDYTKSFFLTERLIRDGRRRIVFLKGPDCIYNSHERCRGYRDAMHKFGLSTDGLILDGGIRYSDGLAAAGQIHAAAPDADAVFAFTDIVGIAAMNRLRELGHRIPEDIAVASFSGTVLSEMVYPMLTTVEAPLRHMGREAAHLLLRLIDNPSAAPSVITVDADIVMRASTETRPTT